MRIMISATAPAAKPRGIGFSGKTKKVGNKVLQQIVALKPNKWTKVGGVGGFVESLDNIDDASWVYPNASVSGKAKVFGSSIRSSEVSGFAVVTKSLIQASKISGDSHVTRSQLNGVNVTGGAEVTGSSLSGKITVMDNAVIFKTTMIVDSPTSFRGSSRVGIS